MAHQHKGAALATFAITFSFHYDSTYNDRYSSFMAEVRKCSTVWDETTSFALVETTETLEALESRLYLSQFSPSRDKMLVINVSYDAAIARGALSYKATLQTLLPGIAIK